MTNWSNVAGGRRSCMALIISAWMLFPSWTAAAPGSAVTSSSPPTSERRIAAYHASPSSASAIQGAKLPAQGHVAEARRVLLELQAFVEQASRTLELGDRLRRQRQENDRLRKSLSNIEAAKTAFEHHVAPMDVAVSALTGTIVRNWLETVRLKYRAEDVDRNLLASEKSRLALETRLATLKRSLIERRSELLALRARRAALGTELEQKRKQIANAHDDVRRIDRQRREIAATMDALRRRTMSTLRSVLLESGMD